jgi:hypothetical protein
MSTVYEVRCHEMGDDSDYLIKSFRTRREAEAYIRHRNEERPQDELYEHWYVKKGEKSQLFPSF